MPGIFEYSLTSRAFTLNHRFTIPELAPSIELHRHPVEEVEALLPVYLWDYDSNGSCWVHTNAIINNPPESSTSQFRKTLQTAEGDIPITVSLSRNGIP